MFKTFRYNITRGDELLMRFALTFFLMLPASLIAYWVLSILLSITPWAGILEGVLATQFMAVTWLVLFFGSLFVR